MIFMHPSVLRFKKHQSTFRFSLLLAVCFGLNQTASFAQLYNYTTDSTGTPAAVALNMTGDALTRGAGVADLSLGCFGPTKGFGSHGWPVIDVARRSIEETAAQIMTMVQERREKAAPK